MKVGNTIFTFFESLETVGRKVVAVTYEIENLNFIQTESFAISGQDGESGRFYYVPIEAGGKKTVTVYYVVDDDIDFNDLYVYVMCKNISEAQTEQDIMRVVFAED